MGGKKFCIPKRRFKEFQNADAWEQCKFGELADYKKGPFGSALKKEIFVPESTDSVKVYEQQNAIKKDWKLSRYFITKKYAEDLNAFETHGGDIIISCAGTIGEMYELPEDSVPGVINQALMRVRINNDLVDKSFYQILFLNMIDDFSKEHSNGSAMKNIPPFADLKPMEALIPKMEEQKKITAFYTNIDNLITLHQRKLEKMKSMKAAYLTEMFPQEGEVVPKRRFSGFTDAWEQRKFEDIIGKLTGGASIAPDDYQEEGIRTIPKGAVNSTGVADLSGSKNVTKQFFERNISSMVSASNLVTSLRDLVPSAPNMGRIVRILGENEEFLMPQGVYKIELNSKTDENFVIAYSNSERYRKIISSEKNGSTQVHIRNGEFLSIDISTPNYEEQTKIGMFFNQLDNLITLHQRKEEYLCIIQLGLFY